MAYSGSNDYTVNLQYISRFSLILPNSACAPNCAGVIYVQKLQLPREQRRAGIDAGWWRMCKLMGGGCAFDMTDSKRYASDADDHIGDIVKVGDLVNRAGGIEALTEILEDIEVGVPVDDEKLNAMMQEL